MLPHCGSGLPARMAKWSITRREDIHYSRHWQQQCNIFASGVNFSKNTHFFVFLSLKLLKFSEIKGVKSLA